MNKRMWWIVGVAAVMAGCSSVKLDEQGAPVEDRAGTGASATAGTGGSTSATGQSRVAPVTTDASSQKAGPAGVERLVYFDYDSYVVKPEYQSLIESHARFLKANPSRKVAVEGHTDERGGREYNLALGQKRAEAVRRALTLLGAADAQIEAVSFGKEKPAVAGGDEASWAKNRRAEISYR